ncbi:metallophosphoesterase [Sinomicrobium weinanense]|uniref:Metallophosphoesterase n=1 Tax=Sinomicrobium weinanense TaxID=2842200 RepID=A0A926Q1N6_9FLAO|nr:metallophosphoesterase [Sinomicrobium weinanense]MBC9794979.1 metallophosphoesterase [Sinomicrobium weinanense]MBU3125160.1 metallophosphoesterase [Sinomicrobium weinanense]
MMKKLNNQLPGRRNFLKNATVLSVAGLGMPAAPLLAVTAGKQPEGEKEFGFGAPPVLANIGPDEAEIIVAPHDLATGWVEYGRNEQLGLRTDAAQYGMFPTSERVLRFKLTGLKPGKEYFYRVHLQQIVYKTDYKHEQGEAVNSDILRFRTLDANADTAVFSCWNDTHEYQETLEQLTAMLEDQRPDWLMWNGDITNNIFREEQIVDQFLKPGGKASAASVPLMLSRGNHDVRGRSARHLQDYLTGPGDQYYYGFRQGPLACIVLDTGEDKPDDYKSYAGLLDFENFREEQAWWLAEVIEQPWFTSAPFRIAFMHIPLIWDAEVPERWPSIWGGHNGWICEDGYDKWHDLLVRGNVQLIISGHTHRHAYFPPNEKRPYGQLIGGGPKPGAATCITGHATSKELKVVMSALDGQVLKELRFNA